MPQQNKKFKPSSIEKNWEKDLEKRGVLENKKEEWEEKWQEFYGLYGNILV